MPTLSNWIKQWPDAPAPEPATIAPPEQPPRVCVASGVGSARPTPEADAAHLAALLWEGAEPVLLNGALFLQGRVTPKAQEIFNAHGPQIIRLTRALESGNVNRQAIARKLSGIQTWTWPAARDAPALWPGREAFLIGVAAIRCVDCRRWTGWECTRYGRLPAPTTAVRCLWAQPHKRPVSGSGTRRSQIKPVRRPGKTASRGH
jgi:hypothetical protein